MNRVIAVGMLLVTATPLMAQYHTATAESNKSVAPPIPRPYRDAHLLPAAAQDGAKHSTDRAVLEQKLAERDRLQREIDALRKATGTPQQILVRLKVVEVSRTKLRRLGIDFATAKDAAVSDGSVADWLQARTGAGPNITGFQLIEASKAFDGFIAALVRQDIAKVLAEPNVAVVSGRPASFNVGGEIPVPGKGGSNAAVEFLNFGTQVDVMAIAVGNNTVRLDLRARVSQPDYDHALSIDGSKIPTLNIRQIDTALELGFGQSGVLTGLVQTRAVKAPTEDEPASAAEEVELLFIATPELIAPLEKSPTKSPPTCETDSDRQ